MTSLVVTASCYWTIPLSLGRGKGVLLTKGYALVLDHCIIKNGGGAILPGPYKFNCMFTLPTAINISCHTIHHQSQSQTTYLYNYIDHPSNLKII